MLSQASYIGSYNGKEIDCDNVFSVEEQLQLSNLYLKNSVHVCVCVCCVYIKVCINMSYIIFLCIWLTMQQ